MTDEKDKVDFSYAFAPPHRITLSAPSGSVKILTDVSSGSLDFSRSWRDLTESVYNVWQSPAVECRLGVMLFADGEKAVFEKWYRAKGGIPEFVIEGAAKGVVFRLSGIAGGDGAVIKFQMHAPDGKAHTVMLAAAHKTGWVISNPAWVDGKDPNYLTCMQGQKADRIIAAVYGADRCPVSHDEKADRVYIPMSDMGNINSAKSSGFSPQKSVTAVFELKEDALRTGYLFMPFEKYLSLDKNEMQNADYEGRYDAARSLWDRYLKAHCSIRIPDEDMSDAFYASFADLFVMRERLLKDRDEYSVTCGTEVYRSPNDGEPTIAARVFDRMGYSKEFEQDMVVHLGGMGDDGDWNTPRGWAMKMWLAAGFKAKMAYEHYRLTEDKAFLNAIYPFMKKNSCWQRKMRLSTLGDPDPSCRGLMPRGMGDCGLMENGDYFGVFYAHNCYALTADLYTRKAALQLGLESDAKELDLWISEASQALRESIEREAVYENGAPHIPSGPKAKENTSSFGALASFEAGLFGFDSSLISGTLKWLENHISEGGLPVGLGWIKDGLWVAIALDNISSVYLRAGHGDQAVRYLYPVVNHASPFITWCEERGTEKNSTLKTGDMQHLWTPAALCEYMLDALCLTTDDGLRLASGIPRLWLDIGKTVGVSDMRVPGGKLTYAMTRESAGIVTLTVQTNGNSRRIEAALRLPEGGDRKIAGVSSQGCAVKVRADDQMLEIVPSAEKMTIVVTLL